MRVAIQIFFPLLILGAAGSVVAQEDLEFEMGEDIFEEYVQTQESTEKLPLVTTFGYQLGHGMDDVANSSRRADIRLQWEQLLDNGVFLRLDNKLMFRHGIDQQLEDHEDYGFDNHLRELYGQVNFDDFTLSIGQQVVVWGEMDSLSVTDIFAPWDYSEFVFTAPEDARIGQPVIQGQWYHKDSSLQLLYVPWPQVNEYPGGDGDELLAALLGNKNFTIDEQLPDAFDHNELGLKWQKSTDAYDVGVMLARIYSNDPVFNPLTASRFEARYPAYRMVGASGNYAMEKFLWKGEVSFKDDLPMAGTNVHVDSRQLALGVDYDANGAYSVAVEHAYQQLSGTLPVGSEANIGQTAFRWSKNYLHETVTATYFFSYQWQYHDRVHSANLDYDINDTWNIQTNVTVFESGSGASVGQLTEKWDQFVVRVTASF